jgi:hypothetical protein
VNENETTNFEAVESLEEGHEIRQLPVGSPEFNAAVDRLGKTEPDDTETDDEEDDTTAGAETDDVDGDDEEEKVNPRSERGKYIKERKKRQAAEAELERLRGAAQQQKAPVPQLGDPAPKLDDYASYAAWQNAIMDWKLDQRELAAKHRQIEAKVETDWNTKEAALKESAPDYDKVVTQAKFERAGMMNDQILQALTEFDDGPAVLYELFKAPELVEKFKTASVTRKIALLGQIEAGLGSGITELTPASTKVSAAPPPRFPKGYAKTKLDPVRDVLDMDDATWFRTMDQYDRDKRRR